MAQPQVYADTDPCLVRVGQLAAAVPGRAATGSHGRPALPLGPSGWVGREAA